MTKFGKLVLTLLLVAIFLVAVFFLQKKPAVDNAPVSSQEQEVISDVWREVFGNKEDLISFSVLPNSRVSGILSYRGAIKGGYFFEGNISVSALSTKVAKTGYATATTDWMTLGPVEFEGNIDLSSLPKGPGYIQIHNDNASGLPENNKLILIPIIIE